MGILWPAMQQLKRSVNMTHLGDVHSQQCMQSSTSSVWVTVKWMHFYTMSTVASSACFGRRLTH